MLGIFGQKAMKRLWLNAGGWGAFKRWSDWENGSGVGDMTAPESRSEEQWSSSVQGSNGPGSQHSLLIMSMEVIPAPCQASNGR